MNRFDRLFSARRALIGVVHLPPLPGYPASPGLNACVDHALADLEVYQRAGFAGVLIENEWDRPHRLLAGVETIATMTVIAKTAVAARGSIEVGVEVLLNDPCASVAIAAASGATFIRTDYFVDQMTRDEYGEMDIDPVGVIEYRKRIGAEHVLLLADIQVKYATMRVRRGMDESASDAAAHGADGIVVTGDVTGQPPRIADIQRATAGSAGTAVLVGSGVSADNAREVLAHCRGAIVGSSLMTQGRADIDRALRLREIVG